jgi:ABC-type dipeptide/oligopeptide/nickel transport system ATPase component
MSLYDIRAAYEALRPALLDDLRRADSDFMAAVELALGIDREGISEDWQRRIADPDTKVHASSGNVFADMGMPDADARLARYEHERSIRMRERGA